MTKMAIAPVFKWIYDNCQLALYIREQFNKMTKLGEHLNFHQVWCSTLAAEWAIIKAMVNTQMKLCSVTQSNVLAAKWPLRDMKAWTFAFYIVLDDKNWEGG